MKKNSFWTFFLELWNGWICSCQKCLKANYYSWVLYNLHAYCIHTVFINRNKNYKISCLLNLADWIFKKIQVNFSKKNTFMDTWNINPNCLYVYYGPKETRFLHIKVKTETPKPYLYNIRETIKKTNLSVCVFMYQQIVLHPIQTLKLLRKNVFF